MKYLKKSMKRNFYHELKTAIQNIIQQSHPNIEVKYKITQVQNGNQKGNLSFEFGEKK
jgi:hypothetical protein